jgi:hypothetical protein
MKSLLRALPGLLLAPAIAVASPVLSFEGTLSDDDGQPIAGAVALTVRLYNGPDADAPIWEEAWPDIEPIDGWVQLDLGAIEAFPAGIFAYDDLWLAVSVDGAPELEPRQAVREVPRAAFAGQAMDVAGQTIHPATISIGDLLVIDADGNWVGPAGLGGEGPAGPQGEVGPIGPQGEVGLQGEAGPVGPEGEAGPQGEAGPEGPQGEAGPQGAEGAAGPAGQNGADGAQGPAGQNGADGAQGPAGLAGADGARGPAGQNGADGAQGPAGQNGADGAQGPAGQNGADGAQGPQGIAGRDGTLDQYGRGASGHLIIDADTDWSAGLPTSREFASITINAGTTLTVPAGTFLRTNGAIAVAGTIRVTPGNSASAGGASPSGMAGGPAHGRTPGAAAPNGDRLPIGTGGGAGASVGDSLGGAGGGALWLLAGQLSISGSIEALGGSATPGTASGAGGGAGGFVWIGGKTGVRITGEVNVRGGRGASGASPVNSGGGGGSGGIVHVVGPNPGGGVFRLNGGAPGARAAYGEGGGGGGLGGPGGRGGVTGEAALVGGNGRVHRTTTDEPARYLN